MNERIKKLRRSLDLTQQDFADRLGTTRNNIAGYETGRRAPSVAVISLICREFNVSEQWLRTGEGEMFAPEPEFNLDEYVKRRGMTALERDILKAYLDLDPNLRETLLQHFKDRLAASSSGDLDLDTIGQERTGPDLAAKLAELERRNQELAAEVAAMKEEDALLGLTDAFSASPSASAGSISPVERVKK